MITIEMPGPRDGPRYQGIAALVVKRLRVLIVQCLVVDGQIPHARGEYDTRTRLEHASMLEECA
jgi:hypothetical protein